LKYLSYLYIFLLVLVFDQRLEALHIIGGEVVYECINRDTINRTVTYQITMTMYRDSKSNGAMLDGTASFGIYRNSGGGNVWSFVTQRQVRVMDLQEVALDNDNPCILVPVNVGVQKGTYSFSITLPIINDSYQIAYQRCCRNNTILNLRRPGDAGAAFTTEISPEAQRICNNSPKFKSFPPVVICVNRPINFDHSAIDIDGDSLVYEFCAPLTAGGQDGVNGGDAQSCNGVTPRPDRCPPPYETVTFNGPNFDFSQPMAGNPIVRIDPATGLILGNPTILGQFVVGVCVKEYRNGVLIGTLRRDFQFNVTTCEVTVNADIKATSAVGQDFIINSCGETTLNFLNLSTDQRYIKNYYWEFDINGQKEIQSSRNTSVTFPGLGTYKGIMILNKDIPGLASCSDTATITVNLFPSIAADFKYVYDTCTAGPIAFEDLSVTGAGDVQKWFWDFTEGKSLVKNPEFEYERPGVKTVRLIAEDINLCRDTIVQKINYFPLPATIVIDPNTYIGCQPANIFFKNLSQPIDSTYQFNWSFGDGNASNVLSPSNIFEDIGTYSVTLELTSPIGCKTNKLWNNLIKVVPSPIANFSFSPEIPTFYENTVQFTDLSVDANSYLWKFDSLDISLLKNPSYTFRDTGTYLIKQIVLHQSGCSDTASAILRVIPTVNIFMPNAYTPNNDGLNDEFLPVGVFFGIRRYKMSIWNRWGERVFDTTDFAEGWNGFKDNGGQICPPGVYAYILEYLDGFDKLIKLKGHVTLIR